MEDENVVEIGSLEFMNTAGEKVKKFHDRVQQKMAEKRNRKAKRNKKNKQKH